MSTTTTSTFTTTTLVGIPSAMKNGVTLSENQCPTCGGNGASHDAVESHRRIQELEGHVQALTERAAVTANKLADYEDELRRLRSSQSTHDRTQSNSSRLSSSSHTAKTLSPTQATGSTDATSQASQQTHSRLATLTSLLPYRRGSAATSTSTTSTPAPAAAPTTPTTLVTPLQHQASPASSDNASELQDALTREQSLRKAAESQLSLASTELEELTVQLFSQANEMVAQERKARAKLEERVAVLERRDIEKRTRLERLEKAMARVERLKALVNV